MIEFDPRRTHAYRATRALWRSFVEMVDSAEGRAFIRALCATREAAEQGFLGGLVVLIIILMGICAAREGAALLWGV